MCYKILIKRAHVHWFIIKPLTHRRVEFPLVNTKIYTVAPREEQVAPSEEFCFAKYSSIF